MSTRLVQVLTLLLFMLTDVHLQAGGRRRVLAVSPPAELAVVFIEGDVLDAGAITSKGTSSAITTKTITIRIGAASREPRGTATLRAFLETPDPRAVIRIDGLVLGTAPRVIQRHAPVGIAVRHRIEIEVPRTAPEGPLNTAIGWEITTE